MTGPRYSQAGLAVLRHGQQVTLTPQNVTGMVPAEGEQAYRSGDRIVPARQALNLLAAVDALPPAHDCPGHRVCADHPRWRVIVLRGWNSIRRTTHYVYRPGATIAEAAFLDHAEAVAVATERARADHLAAITSSEGAGQ